MRILVALGGNALTRGQAADAATRRRGVEHAAAELAAAAADHEMVITHGDWSQVGRPAPRDGGDRDVTPYPPDVLGAEGGGMVGHLLELALRNRLPEREIVTVLIETVVDPGDPAFGRPTRPIAPVGPGGEADRPPSGRGRRMGRDGDRRHRPIPSPEPRAISGLRSLRLLVDAGALVICAAAGVPVALDADGRLRGIEGIVDKDLTAALLARRLDAQMLILLTDVDAVYLGWGTADEQPLREADTDRLRAMGLAADTMAPKVEAACRFAEGTGRLAVIGALEDTARILRGEAGTRIAAAGRRARR